MSSSDQLNSNPEIGISEKNKRNSSNRANKGGLLHPIKTIARSWKQMSTHRDELDNL